MSDVICITNRLLAGINFLLQIEKIAAACPKAIILREKDLTESDYELLAEQVQSICKKYDVRCILHTYSRVALMRHADGIHLPLPELKKLTKEYIENFNVIGASIHTTTEAIEAQKLGATYITAGHIFDTNCKKDLPPRGLGFLADVCKSVSIPVYAIGGITKTNAPECIRSGASGVCIMSALMICEDPSLII